MNRKIFLFTLAVCAREFSEGYIDVTRNINGDLFTNPQWSDSNQGCAEEYTTHYEACEKLDGQPTGAFCRSNENCCKHCQCSMTAPTYLTAKRRCVSSDNLTSYLFNRDSKGCSFRLVPNDYTDNGTARSSRPCEFTELSLPVLDTQSSGSLRIDICGIYTWSVLKCSVRTGAYYGDSGSWADAWDAGTDQNVFTLTTRNNWITVMYLNWNGSLPSRYNGYIMALDVKCRRKFGLSSVESCLLFKTNGTRLETRPSTPPITNSSVIPWNEEKSRGGARDLILIIIGPVLAVIILSILVCLVFLWLIRRRRLSKRKHNRASRPRESERNGLRKSSLTSIELHNPASPSNRRQPGFDPPIYDKARSIATGSPVHTTQVDSPGYQDLLPNKERAEYQALVTKDHAANNDSSEVSSSRTPIETSEDVLSETHDYHVLEGP